MPDEKEIRRRVLLRLASHPLVLGPFVVGLTALAAVWALGLRTGLGLFAGLAGLLGAAGAFLTQWILRGEAVARKVTQQAIDEEAGLRQARLDDLDKHLTRADKDPRPETALRDLRALVRALAELEAGAPPAQLALLVEIRSRVDQLFDQCVHSIQQTDRLWQTAAQLSSAAARKPLLDQRERLIDDVQSTIRQLSDTLVGIQNLGEREGSSRELTRLREELDENLALARTVDARVAALLDERATAPPSSLLSQTPEKKG
ncbi:MAG TPA: hypothetical protein PKM73_17615 [Verrucomicrobiota bacterium]|nr:hypothetical protein [Verrucomicrobiota bacterium]HNU49937.1 hypothetical protein [Verrucomicrobiota bacterium]